MTQIIAINNHKGGVAKTTTCLSLGACLAELGYTVLLVDFDPQAHLTMSLGLEPERQRRTIADALLGSNSLLGITCESQVPGLDIAPANQELALVEKLLHQQKQYECRLRQRLATLPAGYYDFVLIDCSPALNALALNALTAATWLIVPMQCEYYAARSLRQILRLAQLVKHKTNPHLKVQMLITMYDQRNKVSRLILDQLQRSLDRRLYKTIIGIDTKLRESPAYGQPITRYAPQTRAACQYRSLAKELLTYVR